MPRSISILRRRAGLVDLLCLPFTNASGFQVETATLPTGSWTNRFTATRGSGGYSDPAIPQAVGATLPAVHERPGYLRATFDPTGYSIADNAPFWLRVKPVVGGVVGAEQGSHLVMPYDTSLRPLVVVALTAPAGAALANSLELQLPALLNPDIINLEAAPGTALYVAFAPGGPEIVIAAGSSYSNFQGTVTQLFVRGSGGTAAFQMTGSRPYGVLPRRSRFFLCSPVYVTPTIHRARGTPTCFGSSTRRPPPARS